MNGLRDDQLWIVLIYIYAYICVYIYIYIYIYIRIFIYDFTCVGIVAVKCSETHHITHSFYFSVTIVLEDESDICPDNQLSLR